jgi:hypothetical protein
VSRALLHDDGSLNGLWDGWAKRRSIKIRWCKKPENWMAFLKLACADILVNLIFG